MKATQLASEFNFSPIQFSVMPTRITKAQARNAYNNGKTIVLNPSKMQLDTSSPFSTSMEICKAQAEKSNHGKTSFDTLCNHFSYYQCSKETGNVIHFYRP